MCKKLIQDNKNNSYYQKVSNVVFANISEIETDNFINGWLQAVDCRTSIFNIINNLLLILEIG